MIKDLITDLAYDKISLAQALTRAKLIETKINNKDFKEWLRNEIEGYNFSDSNLPKYRKIFSVIKLNAEFPFGKTHEFPVILPDSYGEDTIDIVNHHRITDPVNVVEKQIESFDSSHAYIKIPPKQFEALSSLYREQVESQNGIIRSATREVGKVHYQNVIEQTKQKLLDTLIDLDKEFPNLINDFSKSNENDLKIQNIITNNIYGNNNPTNIAAGENIHQINSDKELKVEDEGVLKSLGVMHDQINELKEILKLHSKDKSTLMKKITKWLGSVCASVAGRGLYESIPKITNIVNRLLD